MNPAMNPIQHWIPLERIAPLIALEPFVVFWLGTLLVWAFYRVFLRSISDKRHRNLKRRLLRLLGFLLLSSVLAGGFWGLTGLAESLAPGWVRLTSYVALLAMIAGAVVVVLFAQVLLYLYLFVVNMRVGFPRLLVNLFTVVFSLLIAGWIAFEVFAFRIAPLLATSAVFSIVLGLALQDTLGNLFSGVALQLDKPYGMGDWVEVQSGGQKWTGQIAEITWRATLLNGFMDELISIPNRTMAQSQVLIFSHGQRPARRGQAFRFPLDTPIEQAREALLQGVRAVPQVRRLPEPSVLVTETAESWLMLKVFYSVEDYGAHYRIGDQVITSVVAAVREAGLSLARPSLELFGRTEAKAP
jgi:small-conductance mechanosensitive channel